MLYSPYHNSYQASQENERIFRLIQTNAKFDGYFPRNYKILQLYRISQAIYTQETYRYKKKPHIYNITHREANLKSLDLKYSLIYY
jgi:hypothetical protein